MSTISAGKLKHLKALSNKDGIIAAAAMDQRGSLQEIDRLRQGRRPQDHHRRT